MRALSLAILLVMCMAEPLIKKEMIERVKKIAKWTPAEYAENIFKGMTAEEMQQGQNLPPTADYPAQETVASESQGNVQAGASCIHEIRDQKSCVGGSFAFAVAGMLSDRCCLKKKDYGWLSPMELVSCDNKNYGCAGGWPQWAANYTVVNGLVDEKCYPYTGNNEDCPKKCKDGQVWATARPCKCVNPKTLRTLDEVKAALVNGPVAVTFEAYDDFFLYKSGIYCHKEGAFKRLISGRAVEYKDGPEPFINIAMSYGTGFGEQGFVRMCLTCCGLFNKYEKGNVACDVA